MFFMKVHVMLKALPSLQDQRWHLTEYVKIGKSERGKLITRRVCKLNESVCGNTVCISESRGNVPMKQ